MKYLLPLCLSAGLLAACSSDGTYSAAPPAEASFQLAGKEWVLVELNGQAVGQSERPATLNLTTDNKINGNGGCNRFFGSYEILPQQRIRFSGVGSTRMACAEGMATEQAYLGVFNEADSYSLTGSTLSLDKGRATALARFEAK
ncbi:MULTISPECIES: META domain-containing protein [Asticcacaulis]|uniref:META domain-containing protein n=1 Tax=Asticcacaulis TaxID=76890 RepID=UPI001AE72F28|nr:MULTISPECIES: META domain-containing protein [Asticcacaulis]MBP2161797.1 heat shock protein HslJ [Asticcacaulis solisilvae]MDR6802843.1 heat shock protein HslJ [Asticcacaulis sp. BE141]